MNQDESGDVSPDSFLTMGMVSVITFSDTGRSVIRLIVNVLLIDWIARFAQSNAGLSFSFAGRHARKIFCVASEAVVFLRSTGSAPAVSVSEGKTTRFSCGRVSERMPVREVKRLL